MLMEELFSSGVMTMGPSRTDPTRQVGVFTPEILAALPGIRAAEMEKIGWMGGEWAHENEVPATRFSPAYSDAGTSRFRMSERGDWLCSVGPDGKETPYITFDPFSRQWIYVLMRGAYGMLRSAEGWVDDRLVFTGEMTMLGPPRMWRLSIARDGENAFSLINEEPSQERTRDGEWIYIDRWEFRRK
jgi:hypothetical protein